MTIELDSMLWRPRQGATVSGEEFAAARSLIMQIHEAVRWNPWVREDRAAEYAAAIAVFEQWTRAEPGFRQKTHKEFEAEHQLWQADLDARIKADTARREQEHTERAAWYDPGRAQARLALLEQQAVLSGAVRERDGIAERRLFPAMPEDRRAEKLTELDQVIARASVAVGQFAELTGDLETVADEHGWLAAGRAARARPVRVLRPQSDRGPRPARPHTRPAGSPESGHRPGRASQAARRTPQGLPAACFPGGHPADDRERHVLGVLPPVKLARHLHRDQRRGHHPGAMPRLAAVAAENRENPRAGTGAGTPACRTGTAAHRSR